MRYIDEFRDPSSIKRKLKEINKQAEKLPSPVYLMEVCGTHTMAIGRFGIRQALPKNIKLISGPGCPVCVTPDSYIDKAIYLSHLKDVIITTFGDMVKVPGTSSSLEKEKSEGRDIRIVYSPLEALAIAEETPHKNNIFLGVGFETTTPAVALAIKKADEEGIKNFYVLSGHKLIPPAMKTLMEDKDVKIDGFICPGHVSVIIGSKPYIAISEKYNVPSVITGFEPYDILEGILILIQKIVRGEYKDVVIQYKRVVRPEGNQKARKVMEDVFEVVDAEWRGIGVIKKSGLKIRKRYEGLDAESHFPVKVKEKRKRCGCICGDILKGKRQPTDCKMFGTICAPESPLGPCMVSSEGTCAAFYRYGE